MATLVKTNKVSQKFDTAEDVDDLVGEIRAAETTVETISLEGNSYGIEAARAIGEALGMCHRLQHLLLNDMFISRLKTEIPEALQLIFGGVITSGATVVTLDLSDNAIGPVTMPKLLPFLSSAACAQLSILRLNNCGLGTRGGNMLSTVLSQLENLTELIIGRNRLEIDGIRDISIALSNLSKLEVLELPQNGTKADGIDALCGALKNNPNIRVLNLNDNVLKGKENSLADVIRGLTQIEVLNFGDCLLKTNGAIEILSAVQHLCSGGNCKIREIILNGNEIGKNAGDTIIATLEQILTCRQQNGDGDGGDDDDDDEQNKLKVDLSANNLGEDLVQQLQDHFGGQVNLIIVDDEGEDDEGDGKSEDDGEGEGEEQENNASASGKSPFSFNIINNNNNNNTNTVGGDDSIPMNTLITCYDTAFPTVEYLCLEFFNVATNGVAEDRKSLTPEAINRLEAIITVLDRRTTEDNTRTLSSPSSTSASAASSVHYYILLLNVCGLLKPEDKRLAPPPTMDKTGALLALGLTFKHLRDKTHKDCVKMFLKQALEQPEYAPLKMVLFSAIYSF